MVVPPVALWFCHKPTVKLNFIALRRLSFNFSISLSALQPLGFIIRSCEEEALPSPSIYRERGGGLFPHPLFIYYRTPRILSTSLQKSLYDFRLGHNKLIINILADIFLYELRPCQKFSKTSYPILIYAAPF